MYLTVKGLEVLAELGVEPVECPAAIETEDAAGVCAVAVGSIRLLVIPSFLLVCEEVVRVGSLRRPVTELLEGRPLVLDQVYELGHIEGELAVDEPAQRRVVELATLEPPVARKRDARCLRHLPLRDVPVGPPVGELRSSRCPLLARSPVLRHSGTLTARRRDVNEIASQAQARAEETKAKETFRLSKVRASSSVEDDPAVEL